MCWLRDEGALVLGRLLLAVFTQHLCLLSDVKYYVGIWKCVLFSFISSMSANLIIDRLKLKGKN